MIEEFKLGPGDLVLDPFCGSGTTLVECMKRGISSVGIDANPSSCFSSQVKTNWRIKPGRLQDLAATAGRSAIQRLRFPKRIGSDPTFRYIVESGMLKRGWISPRPLRKAIALKCGIANLPTNGQYRGLLMLALMAEIVRGASNVRFGPELYRGPIKSDADVLAGFKGRINKIASDIEVVSQLKRGRSAVHEGDSRKYSTFSAILKRRSVSAVICSPPYPTEHDYTRNARLELTFLESVLSSASLRAIKKAMIRSHTKGIYVGDSESVLVGSNRLIAQLAGEIERRVKAKSHGFARLYPKVLCEYFGGMASHLKNVKPFLAPGALCAYVVGDQSSYLGVQVPTAKVLSQLAVWTGYELVAIRRWRQRWATTTSRLVDENILVLRNPNGTN